MERHRAAEQPATFNLFMSPDEADVVLEAARYRVQKAASYGGVQMSVETADAFMYMIKKLPDASITKSKVSIFNINEETSQELADSIDEYAIKSDKDLGWMFNIAEDVRTEYNPLRDLAGSEIPDTINDIPELSGSPFRSFITNALWRAKVYLGLDETV